MSLIQLRTLPGLWVGRRQVMPAILVERREGAEAFQCGACEATIAPAETVADFREVVVKCACGELNQL